MADKNKETSDFDADDFNFDWDDEGEDKAPAKPSKQESADPFGAAALDEEDADPFLVADDGPEDDFPDPFTQSGDAGGNPFDDGIFGGPSAPSADDEEDPFEFQVPPTPSSAVQKEPSGNADDEFSDLEGGFGEADGFGSGDNLFEAEEEADSQADDASGDSVKDPVDKEDGHDPFADSVEEEVETAKEAAPASSSGKNKLIFPLAAALAAVVVGYGAYSLFLPMLGGSPAAPVVSDAPLPTPPSFPEGLPGQTGGLTLTPPPAPDAAQPGLPSLDQTSSDVSKPADAAENSEPMPTLPAIPASEPPAALPLEQQAAAEPTVPDFPAPPALPVDGALPAAEAEEASVAEVPSIEDIVGGEGRGGIDAMRASEPQAESVPAPSLGDVEARIASLEDKMERLSERLEGIASEARFPAAAQAPSGAAVVQDAPVSVGNLETLVPPLKPVIVENATLKGVSRDVAWISTPSGVVEVKPGDSLPVGGKLLKIAEYEGSWVAITTEGLILQ